MQTLVMRIPGHDKFEVYVDRRAIGMVWKADGVWYADPTGMARPAACEVSKEAAVQELVSRRASLAAETALSD